LKTLAITHFQF